MESSLLGVFLVACCICTDITAQLATHSDLSPLRREKRDEVQDDECGVRGPSIETLIAGGKEASVGEFPWHVGVYRSVVNKPSVQDCGGTLITRSLVVTAAHCFWDESARRLKPITLYKVALGKYLRDWEHREHGLQIRDVLEINLPRRYRGRNSFFQYDIAVVKLSSRVDWTELVRPVCVDWNKKLEDKQLTTGMRGVAVGWGVTSNDKIADVLQKVDLPFVDFDTCFDALPENAKRLYTDDKFCAGFHNENRSVCRGDSGGGLVFSDDNDRYYLRGVVSVSFKPEANRDPCYSQLYTGFTLVSQYLSWIKTFVDNEGGAATTTVQPPKKLTVSEKMCELYSSAVYGSVDLPSTSSAIQVSTCAMSPTGVTTKRLLSQPREFPHVAALGYLKRGKIEWKCIGNLISERFVLTAAHCTKPSSGVLKWVRLGSVKLYANNTDQGLVHLEVEEVIKHPNYKLSSAYNDIALLRLKENVTFNGYVRPACLDPYPRALDKVLLTVATWGRTDYASSTYDGLLNGDARVANAAGCNATYAKTPTTALKNGINAEHQFCVKTFDNSTECALLSGSPAMVKLTMPFCMYQIVGIMSFGIKICGTDNFPPSVMTRVSAFTPWIESIAWPGLARSNA